MPKFAFRGLELEKVQKMDTEEFASLIASRDRRRLKRGFTYPEKKLLADIRQDPKKFHRTKSRSMVIVPEMIGAKLGVHNGKEYVQLEIRIEMLGHRLGEFVLTRKTTKHSAPGFGATKGSKYVPLK